jgi:hypothetical protein
MRTLALEEPGGDHARAAQAPGLDVGDHLRQVLVAARASSATAATCPSKPFAAGSAGTESPVRRTACRDGLR